MRRRNNKAEKNEEDMENKIEELLIVQNVNNNERTDYREIRNENNNNFEIPEFLRRADNEQFLQMFIRMRQRHLADGAISLNVDNDDIADQNLELYDNRGINIEPPILNENLADSTEYYLESVNRNKYYKINKKGIMQMDKDKIGAKKPVKQTKALTQEKTQPMRVSDINRATEEQIFAKFDRKLTHIINKTANKICLMFLFTEGLLAGYINLFYF